MLGSSGQGQHQSGLGLPLLHPLRGASAQAEELSLLNEEHENFEKLIGESWEVGGQPG